MWLWHAGPGPLSLDELWRAYLARSGIEHAFKLLKATLGLTAAKVRAPEQAAAGSGSSWPHTPSSCSPGPTPTACAAPGRNTLIPPGHWHRPGSAAGSATSAVTWGHPPVSRNPPAPDPADPKAAPKAQLPATCSPAKRTAKPALTRERLKLKLVLNPLASARRCDRICRGGHALCVGITVVSPTPGRPAARPRSSLAPTAVEILAVDLARVRAVIDRIAADVDELARARRVQDLNTAACCPTAGGTPPPAGRADLEFRAYTHRLPPGSTCSRTGTLAGVVLQERQCPRVELVDFFVDRGVRAAFEHHDFAVADPLLE